MGDVRLLISVASVRDWKPQFGASISALLCELVKTGLGGRLNTVDFKPMMQASNLSEAREKALQYAIDNNFTHWMCFDDDMVFPPYIVDKLLEHDKDVVVCNYRRKCIGHITGVCCNEDATPILPKKGIEKAGFVALGAALIKLHKFKNIQAPHFEVVWNPETKSYWTEDMVFSGKSRQNGVELYVDHDLSKEIEHIGDYSFKF